VCLGPRSGSAYQNTRNRAPASCRAGLITDCLPANHAASTELQQGTSSESAGPRMPKELITTGSPSLWEKRHGAMRLRSTNLICMPGLAARPLSSGSQDSNEPSCPDNLRPFEEARALAHDLNLECHSAWATWCNSGERPADVPCRPQVVYQQAGWKGWPDFLGYDKNHEFLPFEEARERVRNLGLKSCVEWREWSRCEERPADIPIDPEDVYHGKGWVSWADFLGRREGNREGDVLPFV